MSVWNLDQVGLANTYTMLDDPVTFVFSGALSCKARAAAGKSEKTTWTGRRELVYSWTWTQAAKSEVDDGGGGPQEGQSGEEF